MAKCVTYYTQASKIDEFVNCFGVTLEHLNNEDKLLLRAVLAYWAYKIRYSDIKCTLNDALIYVTENSSPKCQFNSKKAIAILEGITNDEVEGLLECLTTQLRWS